ncbi:putative glycosyltransferase [Caudoviricetes sp.]|nr:putative glycosyltransferase [Caudoviricetes sp.]
MQTSSDFKLSWVILTYNRADMVKEAVSHNLLNAGHDIDEIIWVDNGSTDSVRDVMSKFNPDVSILNHENLGVAKGYNRGVVLATGSHIVITGCDRIMPDNWAKRFRECFEKISNTALVSCYSQPLDKVPERRRDTHKNIDGIEIIPAMPMEAKCFPREILKDVGHIREDFGLYGWEDVEWGNRFERVAKEKGLLTYTLPDFTAVHLGNEGCEVFNKKEDPEYHAFKQKESGDPRKGEVMAKCRAENYPYYTPYV